MLIIIGLALLFVGLVSRLFALKLYGRFVQSERREASGRPLFRVETDRPHVRRIVTLTYGAIIGGLALMTAGAIAGA